MEWCGDAEMEDDGIVSGRWTWVEEMDAATVAQAGGKREEGGAHGTR